MRPRAFVAALFVMSLACLVIAAAEGSLGWFAGGGVFLAVGLFARRLGSEEGVPGSGGARLGFIGIAMLVMVIAIAGMAWLSTSG